MTRKHYQELYFHIRDDIFKNYATGYTRAELHSLIKQSVLPMLYDEDMCFLSEGDRTTTKNLSEKGWILFIEQAKMWAFDNFNYVNV